MKQGLIALCLVIGLLSCSPSAPAPVTIAINPWPGYALLYLAQQQDFFEQTGANIKLLQFSSLADAQRAYLNGEVDGLASTLVEAVQSQVLGRNPLKIVMVPDYSNGGDVVIASRSIASIKELKGKTIGCEVTSLGIYLLQRALVKSGLTLSDVRVVNVEQADGYSALSRGRIDALVTYPPVSVQMLKNDNYHMIFSSADIPTEIIDVVSLSEQALKNNPQIVKQLHQAWDLAIDYYHQNPSQAAAIMVESLKVSADDFLILTF